MTSLDVVNECLLQSYTIKNGSISGFNTGRYNNRPLYINNSNAFILTGDQPIARMAKYQFIYGTFMAGIELESVSLETLSQEVVVGLMGITVMN